MSDAGMADFIDGLRRQRELWGTVDDLLLGDDEAGAELRWILHTPGAGLRHGLVTGPAGVPDGTGGVLNGIRAMTARYPQYAQYVAHPAGGVRLPVGYGLQKASMVVGREATRDLLAFMRAAVDQNGEREFPAPAAGNQGLIITVDDAELVLDDPDTADHAARIVAAGGPIGFALIVALPAADARLLAGREDLLAGLTAFQHVEVVSADRDGYPSAPLRRIVPPGAP